MRNNRFNGRIQLVLQKKKVLSWNLHLLHNRGVLLCWTDQRNTCKWIFQLNACEIGGALWCAAALIDAAASFPAEMEGRYNSPLMPTAFAWKNNLSLVIFRVAFTCSICLILTPLGYRFCVLPCSRPSPFRGSMVRKGYFRVTKTLSDYIIKGQWDEHAHWKIDVSFLPTS